MSGEHRATRQSVVDKRTVQSLCIQQHQADLIPALKKVTRRPKLRRVPVPMPGDLLVRAAYGLGQKLLLTRTCHCSQTPNRGEQKHSRCAPRFRACRNSPSRSAQRNPANPAWHATVKHGVSGSWPRRLLLEPTHAEEVHSSADRCQFHAFKQSPPTPTVGTDRGRHRVAQQKQTLRK